MWQAQALAPLLLILCFINLPHVSASYQEYELDEKATLGDGKCSVITTTLDTANTLNPMYVVGGTTNYPDNTFTVSSSSYCLSKSVAFIALLTVQRH